MVCHSPLQWTTLCQTSPPWPICPGWPDTAWLSFIELDMLWPMWSDRLVVCDCGYSLSALWCPLSAPTVLLAFLLPWTWGISSWLLQKSAASALSLGLSWMAFITLRLVSSIPTFWRVFVTNGWRALSKAFFAYIKMIKWFLVLNLLTWYITLVTLLILNYPYIFGINPIWSWCMILSTYIEFSC